ncbi:MULTISPECIES: FxSxx-COOH cyclophane-containing RiPP peptide [Streptomyces]|uniref:FxSxx-COOH cyclophane-containing RiPP peptide n=1 Tax=Streptomyces TaxID=1883 RepID=UPI0004AA0B80|nr:MULTISPECIES: FxSxx-COOH cyclophane-containing RiPP peptide [Streptomyces]RKT16372.1 FXSXX-COOH protein [Streptomyces sp. 1114.5]SOB82542.1 FXSXX-COOH protein [Streptomyces sp. 1331.2]
MGVTGAETATGLGSDLVDVAALPLDELDALPDTVLGDLLRRVVADALTPGAEPLAAFQSSLDR